MVDWKDHFPILQIFAALKDFWAFIWIPALRKSSCIFLDHSTSLILGPLKFICYTEDVSNVFCHHGVKFHLFADDKQAYVSGHVSDANAI